jgi:hypothetical protein
MRRMLGRFQALSFRDRLTLLAALFLLPAVRLGLRAAGFRRLCAFLGRLGARSRRHPPVEIASQRARSTAALLRSASVRGVYRANCLDQSVALWWLLRLQGIDADIRIGVRKDDGLEAHAWVEVGSVVVNDREDVASVFAPLTGRLVPHLSSD